MRAWRKTTKRLGITVADEIVILAPAVQMRDVAEMQALWEGKMKGVPTVHLYAGRIDGPTVRRWLGERSSLVEAEQVSGYDSYVNLSLVAADPGIYIGEPPLPKKSDDFTECADLQDDITPTMSILDPCLTLYWLATRHTENWLGQNALLTAIWEQAHATRD